MIWAWFMRIFAAIWWGGFGVFVLGASAVNLWGWWTGADDYNSWVVGLLLLVPALACLRTGIGFSIYGVSGSGGNPEDYAGGGDG